MSLSIPLGKEKILLNINFIEATILASFWPAPAIYL